jgi:predicted dehydrogenase
MPADAGTVFMSTIRVLLVGFGQMGREHHFPLLTSTLGVDLVGIVRRQASDPISGVPVFGNLNDAIRQLNPQAAVVCTPHALHAAQVRQCLLAGCHIYVEKPLALDCRDAEDLVRLAQERNVLLVLGLQRRYEGFARTCWQLRERGETRRPEGGSRPIRASFCGRELARLAREPTGRRPRDSR